VATDSGGNVYVVDCANYRIQKFDSSGTYLMQWGSNGTGDGQFEGSWGIAIDSVDNVYVADNGRNDIQKFSSAGIFITRWGGIPGGTGDGQFGGVYQVEVDNGGNVYAADSGNNRIEKFSSAGAYITQWGNPGSGDGQFNSPQGIAADGSGNIFVVDMFNNRVQKFGPCGSMPTATPTITCACTLSFTITPTPSFTRTLQAGTPSFTPTATITRTPGCAAAVIDVRLVYNPDKQDYILVEITSSKALTGLPSVRVVPHGNSDNKPVFIYTAALVTSGPPDVYNVIYPKQNAWGDIDSVFVSGVDACGNSFTSSGAYSKAVLSLKDVSLFRNIINPEKGERTRMIFTRYSGYKITIKIYNKRGALIKDLYEAENVLPGRQEVSWDGKNDKGEKVVSGIYFILIDGGSYKATEKVAVIH
jgi:hypothetical protein